MNVRRVAWQQFAWLRAVGHAALALAILFCALVMGLGGATTAAVAQETKAKIAFVGDSTSDGLWGGFSPLAPRNSCLKGTVDLGRFAKNSTGLTRPERYNWPDEVKRIGDSYKPALFIMSLGLNDRQSVVFGGKVTLDTSPDYPARYKERVTAVLKSAAASRSSLLWVGLPAMRDAAADRDARLKNTFFAEAIAEFGDSAIQYVPPWRLNPTGEDKFASYGPDQNGKIIQIRASDGEHFTPAGDMLAAAYLLPKITAILLSRGAKLGDACAS
ncbi:MAG: DUF459 domain-containing protein [Xanthobacteraceae bacterium]